MVLRSGRRGKFVACSGFPRCRQTMPVEKLAEAQAKAAEAGQSNAGASTAAPLPGNNGGVVPVKPWQPGDGPPEGFALTRTGRPVVESMPEPGTLHCPECGSTMELKRGRFGPFFSCSNFPRCKFNANLRGEAKKQAEELMPAPAKPKPVQTDIRCDECGQPMVVRTGRRGQFLGCSAYPKCKGTKELPNGFRAKPEPVRA
jgi:ssDNA-binding Zn-finger/Zn-ribbon topoisomerase 1